MSTTIDWLLSGPAWVQYNTYLYLLHQPENEPQVIQARQAMLADPQVQALVSELAGWPGHVLSSHKSAGQMYHKLNFLADLGFKANDPGMEIIITRVMQHPSEQGPFQLVMNIPTHFGGSGQDTGAWALCDAPLLVYALIKLGMGDHPAVQKAVQHLLTLVRENGWPCAVSPEVGKFRGPGRKSDPCPYATLAMLKVLGQVEPLRQSAEAATGIQSLLWAWEVRQQQHPYMFYMGTDFCKLKAPLVWYDLLHVLDVLSLFPTALNDPRLDAIMAVLRQKPGEDGRCTAESLWQSWKEWEFGQKKIPSRWITLLVLRIFDRIPTR